MRAYHARREAEVAFDELETHQRPPRPLRSRTPVGVVQEVYGLLLAHYVCRAVMAEAAAVAPRPLPPSRLSFLGTLRLLRLALPEFHRTAPADHPRFDRQLLADVAARPLALRRDRSNGPSSARCPTSGSKAPTTGAGRSRPGPSTIIGLAR